MSIIRLTRLAKEARSGLDTTSNSTANADINLAKQVSNDDEKNSYTMEKVVGHRNRLTGTNYMIR